jgi:hypothetical protein
MVSPVRGDYRRCQAETPLIVLCRFPGPALENELFVIGTMAQNATVRRSADKNYFEDCRPPR